MSDFMQRKKIDRAEQFNIRLPLSIINLIEAGCASTGMSQSKFVTLCVLKQSAAIPALVERLKRAAVDALTEDMLNGAREKKPS